MDAYIYRAELYCEDCAQNGRLAPDQCTHGTAGQTDRCDSECWPQGPYADGGGEADSPQHCDACGVFLQNPLTDDGRAYVEDAIADYDHQQNGTADVINEWRAFYADTLA